MRGAEVQHAMATAGIESFDDLPSDLGRKPRTVLVYPDLNVYTATRPQSADKFFAIPGSIIKGSLTHSLFVFKCGRLFETSGNHTR